MLLEDEVAVDFDDGMGSEDKDLSGKSATSTSGVLDWCISKSQSDKVIKINLPTNESKKSSIVSNFKRFRIL